MSRIVVSGEWAVRCEVSWHARAVAHALPQLLSVTVPGRDLLDSALDLALKLEHPVYDCMYVALAEDRQAPLVTADVRLLGLLSGAGWSGNAVRLADVEV